MTNPSAPAAQSAPPAASTPAPAPSASPPSVRTHASRTGRNVLLLAAAMKLLDMGSTTLSLDRTAGLAELALGLGCLLAYELTD